MSETRATDEIDLFSDFATDTTQEAEGVWEPYRGDVEFLIARSGNPKYQNMIVSLVKRNKRVLDGNNEAARKKSDELMIETLAHTVLLGWKGNLKWKGQPLGAYTPQKATELLGVKDFRQWVETAANDHERFRVANLEADAEK
jgi:hypothetical protein